MRTSPLRMVPLEDRVTPAFPIAVDDSFTVAPTGNTRLNVLANDPFPDQVLISSFSTPDETLGTLTRNTDNSFSFEPTTIFNGATFNYSLAPRQPETQLTPDAAHTVANGDFGSQAVLSRDGNIALIANRAAPGGNTGEVAGAGSVFVYVRGTSGWTLSQRLFAKGDASATGSGLDFGDSIAISADGNTLAIGDSRAQGGVSGSTAGSGAVYLFNRSGVTFSDTPQKLFSGTADANIRFGSAVALSADGSTLVVGDPTGTGGNTGSVAQAGAVFVYRRSDGVFTPTPTQRLFAQGDPTATGAQAFGTSLALSDDGSVLAVGAPKATGGTAGNVANGGAVYVFRLSGSAFNSVPQKLAQTGDVTANGEQGYGTALTISGDGNTLAVGAINASGGASQTVAQAGAVYVYRATDGTFPTTGQKLVNRENGLGTDFGIALKLNRDGTVLAISDSSALGGMNVQATNAGAVYLYRRLAANAFGTNPSTKLVASNGQSGDLYGRGLGLSADGNTILIAASNASSNNIAGGGVAYIQETGNASATVTLTPQGTTSPPLPARVVIATGAPGNTQAYLFNDAGMSQTGSSFQPFSGFTQAVQATTADVDGDNIADLIYGIGRGGGSLLRIISGATGQDLISNFATYEASFTGGIFLAAGDIDGDGRAEIVVSPDVGGGGRIQIYSFIDGQLVQRDNFFGIEDPAFRGGARIALGDVDGDQLLDLIVGAGFGGGPRIAIFSGAGLLQNAMTIPKLVNDFFAFPGADAKTLVNGVYVAAGDLDGDGRADLIFGGGPGGGPRVFALRAAGVLGDLAGEQNNPLLNFFVGGDSTSRGGVRVATRRINNDARVDLVVGSGEGLPTRVRTYLTTTTFPPSGTEPTLNEEFDPFGIVSPQGVFVG